MSLEKAVRHIEDARALLVFPVKNRSDPPSLWSKLHPRSKMRWEWDSEGDDRVARLWTLMKRLSSSRRVVYSKWYQGRATFFSLQMFAAQLKVFSSQPAWQSSLSPSARLILEILESDSPLSTKRLKEAADLRGRFHEPTYAKSMKELFSRHLIVAFGEVEDGAFPSLAVGGTRLLFEDLWEEAQGLSEAVAYRQITEGFPAGSAFRKFFDRTLAELARGR